MTNVSTVPLYKLTTKDNPFHPVDEYDDWVRFDEDKGYYTNAFLDRIGGVSETQSDGEWYRTVNDAVDWICSFIKIAVGYRTESEYVKVVVEGDPDVTDDTDDTDDTDTDLDVNADDADVADTDDA